MINHQEEIADRNEMRLETLEDIFYGIDNGYIKSLEDVKKRIPEDLLEKY